MYIQYTQYSHFYVNRLYSFFENKEFVCKLFARERCPKDKLLFRELRIPAKRFLLYRIISTKFPIKQKTAYVHFLYICGNASIFIPPFVQLHAESKEYPHQSVKSHTLLFSKYQSATAKIQLLHGLSANHALKQWNLHSEIHHS